MPTVSYRRASARPAQCPWLIVSLSRPAPRAAESSARCPEGRLNASSPCRRRVTAGHRQSEGRAPSRRGGAAAALRPVGRYPLHHRRMVAASGGPHPRSTEWCSHQRSWGGSRNDPAPSCTCPLPALPRAALLSPRSARRLSQLPDLWLCAGGALRRRGTRGCHHPCRLVAGTERLIRAGGRVAAAGVPLPRQRRARGTSSTTRSPAALTSRTASSSSTTPVSPRSASSSMATSRSTTRRSRRAGHRTSATRRGSAPTPSWSSPTS
jgi:hypothetical protein